MLTRRRILLTGAAGLLVAAAPAIVRAQLWQPAAGVGTNSGPPPAAWTLKAHTFVVTVTGSATTTTPDIDTTGADYIVCGFFGFDGALGTNAVSDNKGNSAASFVLDVSHSGNTNQVVRIYSIRNPTVGSGHHFILTQTVSTFGVFLVAAFAGPSAASPLDQINSATGSGTLATGSITPTQVNDLLVSVAGGYNLGAGGGVMASIDNSFTILDSNTQTGANWAGALAWLSDAAAAAINPTWTWSAPAGGDATLACIASYKHS